MTTRMGSTVPWSTGVRADDADELRDAWLKPDFGVQLPGGKDWLLGGKLSGAVNFRFRELDGLKNCGDFPRLAFGGTARFELQHGPEVPRFKRGWEWPGHPGD